VVEGERASRGQGDPGGRSGVIVGHGLPSPAPDEECYGRRRFPWVPVRPGIDPNDPPRMAGEPGLLLELANEGLFDRFS
jgi:hypothetical protein